MTSTILIAVCLVMPGWVWSRVLIGIPVHRNRLIREAVITAAAALGVGFLWITLATWLLLETGYLRTWLLVGGSILVTILGVILPSRHRGYNRPSARLAILVLLLGFALPAAWISSSPPRGEWVVGGWDPGVYVNQGIQGAVHGSRRPAAPPAFAGLAGRSFNPFARRIAGRDELFPGIPIDPHDGALRSSFYPLTPAWIAFLYRVGGLDVALNGMSYLALLLLLLAAGALAWLGVSATLAIPAVLLLALHPLILYHSRTPCSEMIEALLVCLLAFSLPGDCLSRPARAGGDDPSTPAPWRASGVMLLPLILLAGLLNRPTFLIWAALLLPLRAVTQRQSRLVGMACLLAVSTGLAYYLTASRDSLARSMDVFQYMAVAATLAISMPVLGESLLVRLRAWRGTQPLLFTLLPVLIGLVVTILFSGGIPQLRTFIFKLTPYLDPRLMVLAGIGYLIRVRAVWKQRCMTSFDLFLLLCVCAGMVPLGFPYIADLYPWATKRFVSSLPLALSLCSAVTIAAIAGWLRKGWRPAAPLAVAVGLLVVFTANRERIRDAWTHTEYDGLSMLLRQVADTIEAQDLVLADHFRWATPLTMIFDRAVLNGEPIWASRSPARTQAAIDYLADQEAKGMRLLMLTSTDQGPDLFPPEFRQASLLAEFPVYTYHTIAHHRNASGFPVRERTERFRLYVFTVNSWY